MRARKTSKILGLSYGLAALAILAGVGAGAHSLAHADPMPAAASAEEGAGACSPPAEGETRVVTGHLIADHPRPMYLFRREADVAGQPSYAAILNLRFVMAKEKPPRVPLDLSAPELAKSPWVDSPWAETMRRHVEECWADAAPALVAASGERLSIRFASPTERRAELELPIQLVDGQIREVVERWSMRSTCPTVLHETFHLLGLYDEYSELATGYVRQLPKRPWDARNPDDPHANYQIVETLSDSRYAAGWEKFLAFDCRITNPATSLMKDEVLAFLQTHPRWLLHSCSCPLQKQLADSPPPALATAQAKVEAQSKRENQACRGFPVVLRRSQIPDPKSDPARAAALDRCSSARAGTLRAMHERETLAAAIYDHCQTTLTAAIGSVTQACPAGAIEETHPADCAPATLSTEDRMNHVTITCDPATLGEDRLAWDDSKYQEFAHFATPLPAIRPRLLSARQWDVVTRPFCVDNESTYERCRPFAYATSLLPQGTSDEPAGCPKPALGIPTPALCFGAESTPARP